MEIATTVEKQVAVLASAGKRLPESPLQFQKHHIQLENKFSAQDDVYTAFGVGSIG